MFRTFLSLRYFRARKTNWIGVAGLMVGVGALILILSIMSGFLSESRRHLRGSLADMMITPINQPIDDGSLPSRNLERMLEIIESDPRVVAASPQLVWYGLITPERTEQALERPMESAITLVELVGIDVESEVRVSEFGESLRRDYAYVSMGAGRPDDPDDPFALDDRYSRPGPPRRPMLVGEQLAYVWGLRKGDEVPVMTATFDPRSGEVNDDPSKRSFVVAGTFRSGENEMDLQRAYFDRRDLADFLARNEGPSPRDFSAVLVKLKNYSRDHEVVTADLYEKLYAEGFLHDPADGRGEIRTWEDRRQNILRAIENERVLMAIMLGLVLLVACFTVVALLSMMVTEKRRDIGILCALGANADGVMSTFVLIGLWQALFGVSLGVLFGVWGAFKIDAIEQWLSSTLGFQIFDRNVYFFDHIPSVVDPVFVASIAIGAVLLTLIAAAIPAWRASRLDPVDALRYE